LVQTLHSIYYSAPKVNVKELSVVAAEIEKMFGKKFVKDIDATKVNDTIRDNINIISPPLGAKLDKLKEIASKAGISYEISEKNKLVKF